MAGFRSKGLTVILDTTKELPCLYTGVYKLEKIAEGELAIDIYKIFKREVLGRE